MSYPINDTRVLVYELPDLAALSAGFCFGGGNSVPFLNVDWFNGFDGMREEDLRKFVSAKNYIKPGRTYLVMSPENDIAFFITKEPKQER